MGKQLHRREDRLVTLTIDKTLSEALQFPRESRAFLAEKLLESLDFGEEFDVSDEWRAQVRRRCREIDLGTVELLAADEVFDELHRDH